MTALAIVRQIENARVSQKPNPLPGLSALASCMMNASMCTLRAWGKYFDVDRFLAGSHWKVSRLYHRGRTNFKKKSVYSGFNLGISNASWKTVGAQAKDAVKWIRKNGPELRRLKRSSGLEGITLDFPVNSRLGKKVAVQCDRFPAALVAAAGEHGLEIELSIYG